MGHSSLDVEDMVCGVRDRGADGEAVRAVARGAVEHVEVGGGGKELLVVASRSARSLSLSFPRCRGPVVMSCSHLSTARSSSALASSTSSTQWRSAPRTGLVVWCSLRELRSRIDSTRNTQKIIPMYISEKKSVLVQTSD